CTGRRKGPRRIAGAVRRARRTGAGTSRARRHRRPAQGRRAAATAHAAGAGTATGCRQGRQGSRRRQRRGRNAAQRHRTGKAARQRGLAAARARRSGRPAARQVPARIRAAQGNGRTLMPRWLTWLLCALLAGASLAAHAQTRAWIDRDSVALGETLTLNVETDDSGAGAPDWSPLDGDFIVSGNSSSRQVEIVNGKRSARLLFGVALQPPREGLLTIPALQVGKQRTQPIQLTVTEAAPPARAGADAFIEAQLDDEDPYVQQAVGYTLRLYYAMPLVSGQLDQDAPDGASLQRVGSDLQYTRLVGGKRYTVVERRFLLVPERSGPMTIPGARFSGRSAGGFFDDMFGGGTRELSANGAPRFITVRPVPAKASQPWLPLRGLGLRYLATPQQVRAGEAATVTIEARADGATASQLPEVELPAVDGAQVFAEPAQTAGTCANGRPQVTVTRKFSIVPSRAGALRIPGPRIAWWDVRAGAARTASLPDVQLQVAPGVAGGVADAVSGSAD